MQNDLLDDFNPMQYSYDDFIESPETLNECIDLGKHSLEETETLHEKIKALFTLKKQWSIKEDKFYKKTDNFYEIIKYITDQIEIEKFLLRSQNDSFSKQSSQKNIKSDIQTFSILSDIMM